MLDFKRFGTQDVGVHPTSDPVYDCPISPNATKLIFAGCDDFVVRDVRAGGTGAAVTVCWLDGTVSGADAAEQLLKPLTDMARFGGADTQASVQARLDGGAVYGSDLKRVYTTDELVFAVAYGCCAVVMDGAAYVCQLKTDRTRSVSEPTVEKSVKGSRDSFVETLRVNTALVRARLRTPGLKLTQTTVGRRSRTDAAVLWLDGVADPALPRAALRRLRDVDIDGLVLPDVLDDALCDKPGSPFPQVIHTERPDRLAAALLDGRVGVLADGMPVAFVVPADMPAFLTSGEDGARHFIAASFVRALRWAALFITLVLPALYVSVSMYHAEMIPTELLLSVIGSKQSVPFSTAAEILGMLLSFELLQEAGLRLPDPVGQTASIIGALIVGQSAVEARVVSPIAVIVVAVAGIAGYTMPSQDMSAALRLCRFGLAAAAALSGLFGVVVGLALILWHLCSLESFGHAYIPVRDGRRSSGAPTAVLRRPPRDETLRDETLSGGNLRRRA